MPFINLQPESVSLKNTLLQIKKSDSGKVFVFADSLKFTLIPFIFYSKELRDQYFTFAHKLEDDEIILENEAIKGKYIILFSIKRDLINNIEFSFPDAEIFHFTTVLSSRIIEAPIDNSIVLINRQKDHFYLLIRRKNEIVLLNSYKINHVNDICYYILNGLREAVLKPNHTTIWYSGRMKREDKLIDILQKYTLKVEKLPDLDPASEYNPICNYFQFHQTENTIENNQR